MPPLFRGGFWCSEVSEKSSNIWEFKNLLEAIQEEVRLNRLMGREAWIATDNSTAEAALTKGRSSSPELDEMVLELRELALKGGFILKLFHVAGTRMIALGIDSASRGELHVGALLGEGDSSLVPLHLGPVGRSPAVKTWVQSWARMDARVATPADWLYAAQQAGEYDYPLPSKTWIWSLPPAAALYAIEKLGNGCLKHHGWMTGMVLVPSCSSRNGSIVFVVWLIFTLSSQRGPQIFCRRRCMNH